MLQMSSSHRKRVPPPPLPAVAKSRSAHAQLQPVHVLVCVSGLPPPPPVKRTSFWHCSGGTIGVQLLDGSGRSCGVVGPESGVGTVSSSSPPLLPDDVDVAPPELDDDFPPSLLVDVLFKAYGGAQDEIVFKFANDVYADQSTEIDRMKQMLEEK